MSRLLFILLVFVSQSVFAELDGESEIKQFNKKLSEQTVFLQETMDSYTKYNRNYWDSEHNKKEEMKLLFDIHNFISSMKQFNNLIERNKIDFTYYELPYAYQRVLEDFVDVDEQIKLLDEQRRNRREFDRHFNLTALRRDAEDIQITLQRLSPVIQRIRVPQDAVTQPVPKPEQEPVIPKERVTIESLRLYKDDARKPKYEIKGHIEGPINRGRIIVQRTFSGTKKYDLKVDSKGNFTAYFRNYWNASSIHLEIQFTNGEKYSREIDVDQ